jgi:hypothetical protein
VFRLFCGTVCPGAVASATALVRCSCPPPAVPCSTCQTARHRWTRCSCTPCSEKAGRASFVHRWPLKQWLSTQRVPVGVRTNYPIVRDSRPASPRAKALRRAEDDKQNRCLIQNCSREIVASLFSGRASGSPKVERPTSLCSPHLPCSQSGTKS